MKRILIILLFFTIVVTVKAQEKESLSLFTDRDLYVSGENLLFKIFAPAGEQSGIVHVDLINRGGKKIEGIIVELIDHQADGFIDLSDSLSSGCYLVRASTIQNKTVTFKELYISNRFTGLPESNADLFPSEVIPINVTQLQTIQVSGVEKQYKPGEKGKAILQLPAELISAIEGNLSVSIANETPGFTSRTFLRDSEPKSGQVILKEGIILEGLVTDLKTAEPFKNAVVYLSIPDSIPGFQYFITGEDGRFYFKIGKYYGKIPVVIQCFALGKPRLLKITLTDTNNPASIMPVFERQSFSPELRNRVEKNTDVVTFRKIFNQQEITSHPSQGIKTEGYPFYGIPTRIADPQQFIDLPDFSEISRELLPGVKFRTYNRIPTLQVFNFPQQMYFNEQPLLLLDGIPIRDLTIIKDMGSKDIDKIEVCQSERFYGDLIFPGVVAIYTSRDDYTRVPESDDLIKLNLDVIQPGVTLNAPSEKRLNNPDLRQVLLWIPSVKPEPSITLDFQASDILGSYKLILTGKNRNGSIFYKEQIFEVN